MFHWGNAFPFIAEIFPFLNDLMEGICFFIVPSLCRVFNRFQFVFVFLIVSSLCLRCVFNRFWFVFVLCYSSFLVCVCVVFLIVSGLCMCCVFHRS